MAVEIVHDLDGLLLSALYEKQLKTYEKKWIESENNLKAFKQKHQIISYDQQKSLALKQRSKIDSSLKQTQNRIKELEQKISSLEIQMQSIPKNEPIFSGTPTNRFQIIDKTKSDLLALKRKENELSGKYKNFDAGNQLLTSVRAEIKLVEDYLEKQKKEQKENVKTGVNKEKNVTYKKIEIILINAKANLSSLSAKKENIIGQLTTKS